MQRRTPSLREYKNGISIEFQTVAKHLLFNFNWQQVLFQADLLLFGSFYHVNCKNVSVHWSYVMHDVALTREVNSCQSSRSQDREDIAERLSAAFSTKDKHVKWLQGAHGSQFNKEMVDNYHLYLHI